MLPEPNVAFSLKPDIETAGVGHSWGVSATGNLTPISLIHGVGFSNCDGGQGRGVLTHCLSSRVGGVLTRF